MEILLFSDLHIYNHFAKTVFEDTAQKFLIHIYNHCIVNNIKKIIFLGDFFHLRNKISVPSYIKSLEILKQFKSAGIEFIFLIGNHDMPQADSTEYSIMYSLENYGQVISHYDWHDIDDVRFHLLSYTNQLPNFELSPKKNILLGHLDVNNFIMEGNFICNNGFPIQIFNKFDYVFSGHFHKHQIINNIIYVGSPYQVRYSERFDEKGFIILDTNTLEWRFNSYGNAPVFKEIIPDQYDEKEIKGNFIRIKTKSNQDLTKIKEELMAAGAESVDFIFENEDEVQELNVIEDLATGSMKELAQQYITFIMENNKLKDELKDISKDEFIQVFDEIETAYLTGWKPKEEIDK